MDQYITTITLGFKKPLATNPPLVTNDTMKPGGALSQRLNHNNPHWPKPVIDSGVSCQHCWVSSGEKFIAHIQTCILCNSNLFVKNFVLFHMRRMLVQCGHATTSPGQDPPNRTNKSTNKDWNGKNNKFGHTVFLC